MNNPIFQLLLYSDTFSQNNNTGNLIAAAALFVGITMLLSGIYVYRKRNSAEVEVEAESLLAENPSPESTTSSREEETTPPPSSSNKAGETLREESIVPSLNEVEAESTLAENPSPQSPASSRDEETTPLPNSSKADETLKEESIVPSLKTFDPIDPTGPTIPTDHSLDASQNAHPSIPTDGVLINSAGKIVAMGDGFRAHYAMHSSVELPIPITDLLSPEMANPALAGIATLQFNPGEILLQEGNFSTGAPSSVSPFRDSNGENLFLVIYPIGMARILIADDEPRYRMMVAHCLRRLGYTVEEGAHGKEAVEIARDWHPDLVLMDLNMPGMSGFEASRQLRREQGDDNPSIVAISGMKRGNVRQRCAESGIDNLVPKPFDLNHLSEVIEEHLQNQEIAA